MKKKIKTIVIIAVATVVAGLGIFVGVRQVKLNEYKSAELNLPKDFTITAHTGCMDTEDNSLESVKQGAENGASIVEFDLYFTEDGEPVLAHDEPVGGEVTLDEAFQYVSTLKGVRVNVDVKTCDALGKVYPLAKKYGIENRIFYTGVNEDFVEAVKKDSPQVKYYLNTDVEKSKSGDREYVLSLVEKVKSAGAVGINFNYKSATKELVEAFHENGLLVSIWTVDDEFNMYKVITMEPDNITTRHPDKLSKIVENYQ